MKKLSEEKGNRNLSNEPKEQKIKDRFENGKRKEFYNKFDSAAKYSEKTQALIDDLINYISGKKIKLLNYNN